MPAAGLARGFRLAATGPTGAAQRDRHRGGHPLDLDQLVKHNVVFEIEDVGDDQDKAFLMGALLIQLTERLRVEAHRDKAVLRAGLRHLSIFEEAHRLLRQTEGYGPASHAVELFASLLAEIRAYGEGLVIAEQIPSKLVHDVVKNTAVKIMHRLPAQDDRQVVGATVNLTDAQSRYLVTLPPGTAAVFNDGMDHPILVRMPDGTDRENGHRQPASVVGLIRRRSDSCGTECLTSPCTQRDMSDAQHRLATNSWIVLWAELAVLAHLTGWWTPAPQDPFLDALRAMPSRVRDCTISHAVDAAVQTRATATTDYNPAELATHITDVLRRHLASHPLCDGDEPRWVSRPYRWGPVRDALRVRCRDHPDGDRHPRSEEWRAFHGREITGLTAAEQLQSVQAWFLRDLQDNAARRIIAWGARPYSAVEEVVGTRRDDPDWTGRLTEFLGDHFTVQDVWPQDYLSHGPAEDDRSHPDEE
ncbi:hypothetical protein [Actinoplanes sp. NPDC051851]|uniref:ATP-binding protein n=1 Tax=Actinoplanes sp. NPDC051851 TaxID=3154753 RepID=UPI003449F345